MALVEIFFCDTTIGSGFFNFYKIAADIINGLLLTKVGTHQIAFRVDDFKVWVTIIEEGNPNEPFFTMNKQEWDKVKKFIDCQLTEPNIIEIQESE